MKKIVFIVLSCFTITSLLAQETPETPAPQKETINLSNRANDHLLIQFGYAGWAGVPDSINMGGFSRSFNVYFMFDFPFKSNPKLSLGVGIGVGSDHIKFKKTYVGIKDNTSTLQFRDQADTNHFKKTKLATSYLEAPVELRYTADPVSGKGLKLAIGVKVGTLMNAHTRNKTLETSSGGPVSGTVTDYSLKEGSKNFFTKTRLAATARVGLGHISLFGSYQITSLFKEAVAASIHPYAIGITLSGL